MMQYFMPRPDACLPMSDFKGLFIQLQNNIMAANEQLWYVQIRFADFTVDSKPRAGRAGRYIAEIEFDMYIYLLSQSDLPAVFGLTQEQISQIQLTLDVAEDRLGKILNNAVLDTTALNNLIKHTKEEMHGMVKSFQMANKTEF